MEPKHFSVDAGNYPRALSVAFERITVLASGDRTGSYEIFLQEAREGSGPFPHSHPWDEAFFVTRGEVDFSIGDDQTHTAVAGTLVHIPAGTTHWFRWRSGGGAMISITSKLGASRLFADLDREMPEGPRDPEKAANIFKRHGVTLAKR